MKKKVKIKDIALYSKGTQISGDELLEEAKFDYLNGGIKPSGKWDNANCVANTVTISEGGNSCGYVNFMKNPFWCGAHCYFLYDTKIDSKYLYYALKSQQVRIMKLRSGACMPNIKKTDLGNFEFVCDDNSIEQKKVTHVLDKLESVIEQRKNEIQVFDELVKARFVEMFGDARKNPNKYDTVSFIDIVEYMGDISSNGANKVVVDHLDMKDKEDYAMMVRFTNFTKNDFTDDVKYVSKEAYDFFKKSQIFGGELIICKIGSAGQNYVMPYLNRPASLGLNQIMVRIKDNILMPYLYQYLHTDYGEFLISGCINGAVTKTITKTELKKIPVMLPSMELQREFVAFVEQVDKSKAVIEKSLKELETLQASLMQKYFS